MNAEQGPIEVWLTQTNLAIRCLVVGEDESTDELELGSVSLRGAEREITGYLLRRGYEPASRWQAESDGDVEVWRRFRPRRKEAVTA